MKLFTGIYKASYNLAETQKHGRWCLIVVKCSIVLSNAEHPTFCAALWLLFMTAFVTGKIKRGGQ